MITSRHLFATAACALVMGCASKPAPPLAIVPAPAPMVALAPPMPAGAAPGMIIPAVLPDGSYPTPNRALSSAAAVWHLRAALNVAALACRGAGEAATVAGYNALLAGHKASLADAEKRLSAEYRATGTDWQDRYDDAMTRLYNFFSQTPARAAFCQTADTVLAEAAIVPTAELSQFAAARLPVLDATFTDFYRAYDAWRAGATPVRALPRQMIAYTDTTASSARVIQFVPRAVVTPPRPVTPPLPVTGVPRLELDASVFAEP